VVFIIGDFTGMIGDPSGRSETRPPLTRDQIKANARLTRTRYSRFSIPGARKCVSTRVVRRHDVRGRLEIDGAGHRGAILAATISRSRFAENNPISLVEFMYPLIQGYDSVMIDADIELAAPTSCSTCSSDADLQKARGKPSRR